MVIKKATINFIHGIMAIIGPNEAGKSTIIEGVLFSLFGKRAFRDYEHLIHFESNHAKISLIFSVRDNIYRVNRELRKSKSGSTSQINAVLSELTNGEEHFIIAKGVSNVDSQIERIIGFSYNELTASNIIAQKKLNKISKMTPQEWKELFNEFLNLKGFGDSISELKEEKKEKQNQLNNDEIRLDELKNKKDDYWSRFKELIRLSKNHYRKARTHRKLSKEVEILSKYLKIVKDYIEKRDLKMRLQDEMASKEKFLNQYNERLAEIEALEEETAQLKHQLEIYKGLNDDEKNFLNIKNHFENYQKTLKRIEELKEKLRYIIELEGKLENKKEKFIEYKDMPNQLKHFRDLESSYKFLEVNVKERNSLEEELNKVITAEKEVANLKKDLLKVEEDLSYKNDYIEAENKFREFKAKYDQIKYERDKKEELKFEITKIKKTCPKETPEELGNLKEYKDSLENLVKKGLLNYITHSFKWNLPILIGFIIISLIPIFFGRILYSFIGIGAFALFFIYLYYKYLSLQALVKKLENLIFSLKKLQKIKEELKSVEKSLEKKYISIAEIIKSLSEYYSSSFQATEGLKEQVYSLNLYFQEINKKLNSSEARMENLNKKIKELKKLIKKKPKLEYDLENSIKNIHEDKKQLDAIFSDGLEEKYIKERIDKIYYDDYIDFSIVKQQLKQIENIILKDFDQYNILKREIEDLKTKTKDKSTVIENLKKKQKEKQTIFNTLVELIERINQKYINSITSELTIHEQVEKVIPFENSIKKLNSFIQEDKNARDKLEAQINTNSAQINKKPEVIKNINNIKGEIQEIISNIKSIVFPIIPEEISNIFDKNKPKDCQNTLENEIIDLDEKRNQIYGEMKSINTSRTKIRNYLKDNEQIIHDFFKMKKKVENLEREIKIYSKSIDLLEQVNRKIWDLQMPYIYSYIKEFLPKITMGRYRNMIITQPESRRKKKYEFKVFEETIETYIDKKYLSGGTDDQILLVIRVAVAMSLLPQSKGHYPKFIFIDEAFASSDAQRRMEILNWLKKDLSSIFTQIIIISHQKEIIEEIPYYYKLNRGDLIDKFLPDREIIN